MKINDRGVTGGGGVLAGGGGDGGGGVAVCRWWSARLYGCTKVGAIGTGDAAVQQ